MLEDGLSIVNVIILSATDPKQTPKLIIINVN